MSTISNRLFSNRLNRLSRTGQAKKISSHKAHLGFACSRIGANYPNIKPQPCVSAMKLAGRILTVDEEKELYGGTTK